jgi:anti-sigma factor RsiW
METWRLADLHAYVDDCLESNERLAFEKQIAQDPSLAHRAASWRAQNSAICSAFDGEGARAFPISIVRHQNEVLGKGQRLSVVGDTPSCEQSSRLPFPTVADASTFSRKVGAPDVFRPLLLWRLGFAALSLCLACVWAPAATIIPTKELGEADVAAFRAFVRPGVAPVESATNDRTESQVWLAKRLMRPLYLPATPPAITLVGARIAPYPGAAAAFLVYKSQDRLIGLLIQPLDAPATRAPQLLAATDGAAAAVWTWRGQGFALAGELDAASLLKIATDFFDPSTEAAQPMPERAW